MPANIMPTADNIQMDVNSNSEAEQAAQELAQAHEWVHTANEAQEKHQEEWKRKEEEEKEAQWIAAMEVAAKEVEEMLER